MANKIKFDVHSMEGASQKLKACTDILDELKGRLDGANGTLSTSWKGEAARAFAEEYMEPLKEKLALYSEMIGEFSSLLLKIKKQYEEFTEEAEKLRIES